MIAFDVKDMTCGHCASTIAKAVRALDPQATVNVTLASHRVEIGPCEADASELGDAIRDAGYTPVCVAAEEALAFKSGQASGGCCCRS